MKKSMVIHATLVAVIITAFSTAVHEVTHIDQCIHEEGYKNWSFEFISFNGYDFFNVTEFNNLNKLLPAPAVKCWSEGNTTTSLYRESQAYSYQAITAASLFFAWYELVFRVAIKGETWHKKGAL